METQDSRFCNGKYSVFKQFLICKIFSIVQAKKKSNKTSEYHPDEVDNNLIENKHKDCS